MAFWPLRIRTLSSLLVAAFLASGLPGFGPTATAGDSAGAWAAIAGDPATVAAKVQYWLSLVRSQGTPSFTEAAGFIDANPHWPLQKTLQQRAEEGLSAAVPADFVASWFQSREPATGIGGYWLARAHLARGEAEAARAVANKAWVAGTFSAQQETEFLADLGHLISPASHRARLDALAWRGRDGEARRMFRHVGEDDRILATARLDLRAESAAANRSLAQVPARLASDPGLVYERVRWRRGKGLDAEARSLLLEYPGDPVEADRWWTERQILVRRALSIGLFSDAYRLAKGHGLAGGPDFVDAEFLAGWIALRFLGDAAAAEGHFRTLAERAETPISRSRGAYWAGRAAEARGLSEEAARWYREASDYPTAFYGQLAAARLGPDQLLALPADPVPSPEQLGAVQSHELALAARSLLALGEETYVRTFFLRLAEMDPSPQWKAATAEHAFALGRPDLAVFIARQAARDGSILIDKGYPTVALPLGVNGYGAVLEPPLALAVIRQESAYQVDAVSSAGARGLMQLMPATAKQVAGKLSLPYSTERLTSDPEYNLSLGLAYMESMLNRFDGSYVLALSAYNAGPGRAKQWREANGAHQKSLADAIDWVEMIPFDETRNYVQRILEHLQVYRVKVNGASRPGLLEQDLLR